MAAGDHERGVCFNQRECDAEADALTAASDDGYLAVQLAHRGTPRCNLISNAEQCTYL